MALTPTEQRLKAHLLQDCAECLRLRPRYNPYIFQRMIGEHGPVEACRRVIMELPVHQAPSGYAQLWERGRLDLTAEATVLQPEWSDLFEPSVLQRAEGRLRRCGWPPTACRIDGSDGFSRLKQGEAPFPNPPLRLLNR